MSDSKCLVVEWSAWDNFLLPHILGDRAERFQLSCKDPATSDILLREAKHYSQLAIHIDLTDISIFPYSLINTLLRIHHSGADVINIHYLDISKSKLHRLLRQCGLNCLHASKDGPLDELLIVKTDLNFGGFSEKCLLRDDSEAAAATLPVSYYVIPRGDIKEPVWSDPAYVIERYVCNRDDAIYRVYFLRSSMVIVHAHCTGYIKKVNGDSRDTNYLLCSDYTEAAPVYDDLPPSLVRICLVFIKYSKLDFGSLDVVYNDAGECYIVDVNRTPWAGKRQVPVELLAFLGLGLAHHTPHLLEN